MKNNKWKKIISGILAVCLVATLLLSNQSFGVFAEEKQDSAQTMQEDVNNTSEIEKSENDTSETETIKETDKSEQLEINENTEDNSSSDETDMTLTENVNDNISVLDDSADLYTWKQEVNNILVEGNGTDAGAITVERGENESLYQGDKVVAFDYNISSTNDTSGELGVTISDCGIMSDDSSLEIWHVKNGSIEKLGSDAQISEGKVQFTATELGEYIAVSNVVTADLTKGNITVSYDSFNGFRQDGANCSINLNTDKGAKYRIAQSNNSQKTENGITFTNSKDYVKTRIFILDGINTSNYIGVEAYPKTVMVTLQLRNVNQVAYVKYCTGKHEVTSEEDNYNKDSKLTIENYDKENETSGELYVPYKMESREAELKYILNATNRNPWAQAGIGAGEGINDCTGLTIAGGTIRVIGRNVNGGTAIGGGANGDAQISITGGDVTAISSTTGTAIGGGIGWIYRGGNADVSIMGGKVYAENVQYRSASGIQFGGVAIGSGSSNELYGSKATIKIGGNSDVTAYARYGNGIGSGNSYSGNAANAEISLDGNCRVSTNALGGGISKSLQGGSAEITVKDNAVVNCIKYSEIDDKWDTSKENILNAFGIGGGNSAGVADGGAATVKVYGGTLNCNGGNIGGGDATGTGAGGNASIYVSGGTLDCASIGGGNSKDGTPGAVSSSIQSPGVVVKGGTLKAGTIGGGTNTNGDIGFATADISGGTIQGQFILSNTVKGKQCKFTMIGGTIDNTSLSTDGSGKYQMAQKNGGAVYLSDSNGEVSISGGTIQNCKAELGGAVYMTAGTVNLSGTGKIKNCKSTGNTEKNIEAQGGAIYLQKGTVNVSGGEISECSAEKGAAVYMQDGEMSVSDGSIKNNTADQLGGGAYISSGNMSVSSGDFTSNNAQNGAGVYLAGGNLNVNGNGTFNLNKASENGGAAYLANGILTVNGGTISSNTATTNGGGFYLAGGKLYITAGKIQSNKAKNGAGAYVADSTVRMFGGDFTGNQASDNGGGMYISSTSQAADVVIRSGNLINNSAGNSGTASDQGNGGAIAVVSSNSSHPDHVIIGLRKDHGISDYSTREYTSFSYKDDVDDNKEHDHAACPTIEKNTATGNGGGIYMSSSASVLDIYCLLENDNTATKDTTGGSIMSEGGKVNIGDIGDGGPGEDGKGLNNTEKAVGNVYIQSKMLVKGGDIKLFGNTDNPKFAESILVDIEKGVDDGTQKGSFNDYRYRAITGKEDYKIEYFENFQGSGKFESRQYDEGETIYAIGNMFEHTGWKILGWDENPNAINPTYKSGAQIPSSAWNSVDSNTGSLTLYAIWKKITYTVHYEANITGVTVSGAMDDQIFEYNDGTALKQNGFKVKGKRFISWNTEKNGQGTSYEDGATEKADGTPISTLTSEDGAEIPLYAQWKDCTHTEADHAVLSYQINKTAHSITEICDCEGYTATVQIAAENVYFDGATHPATLTGTFLNGQPTIRYIYKENESDSYGNMPEGTTVPKEIGYYKATITATDADGEKSVSVEYQIKSPADAAAIEATIQKGEQFSALTNTENCSVAQDDAFTVRYVVSGLNAGVNNGSDEENGTKDNKVYKTAPVLTVSQQLPVGTTIIMQTNNEYWYNNDVSGKDEIDLTSFRKMGGTLTDIFEYDTSNINDEQSYRFIVDFSGVSSENYLTEGTKLTISLKYAYTNPITGDNDPDQNKNGTTNVTINPKADFTVTKQSDNVYQVDVLSDTTNTRYAGKNLVWKIALKDSNVKLPSDAELTLSKTTGENTQTGKYALNANGEFVIPFEWTNGQQFTFALSSDQEALSGSDHSYQLTATLCVGSNTSDVAQPKSVEDQLEKTSADIALQIPINSTPSMKISGTDKVLTKEDSLKIHIKHTIDLDKYSVEAKIEKMQDGEYKGDNGRTKIDNLDKDYTLGLQSTTGAGCYRVCIVITKNGNTVQLLSEEPYYYFIVQ